MSASYLSLIEWPRPFFEFTEFFVTFLALGAIGFRYSSLRGKISSDRHDLFADMAQRAAVIGAVAALIRFGLLLRSLPGVAARAKVPVAEFLTTPSANAAYYYLIVIAIIGFLLAAGRLRAGWPLAAIALISALLRNVVTGRWQRLMTPLHVVTGGLWLGTLAVLVIAGIGVLFKRESDAERRGAVAADLVHAFSPLALVCGIALVGLGVYLSIRELKPFSALWTTPYGYTLIAKLCVVAVVFGLGAWNWRRQRPALGTEPAARGIQRSATWELTAATIVLIITSLMLSLPETH